MTSSERNQRYYQANQEKEKERSLEYYRQNKHKIDREAKRAYMAEYLKTYKRRKHSLEDRAEINGRRRARYAADPEFRAKEVAAVKLYYKRNPETRKNSNIRTVFGITMEDYKAMLLQQGNACAICRTEKTGVAEKNKKERSLAIDHDHATGKVRGLLCHRCNFGLGHFKDNPDLLTKAAAYLTKL